MIVKAKGSGVYLTKDKDYIVFSETEEYYVIIDNAGSKIPYLKSRFKI